MAEHPNSLLCIAIDLPVVIPVKAGFPKYLNQLGIVCVIHLK